MQKINNKREPFVVYESPDLIVLEKPSSLLVHPTLRGEKDTLVSWLVQRYPEVTGVGEDAQRPGIVHRLDKETSGLIVIARNQDIYVLLKSLFHDRKILKKYFALVQGVPKENSGVIEKEIAAHGGKRRTVEKWSQLSSSKVRAARTDWEVVDEYKEYTLLCVRPLSGRTHQIRVHLASIGLPVVCDPLYGKKQQCPQDLGRLFLHAYFLQIPLAPNNMLEFEIKMPEELTLFLKQLN